MARAAHESGQYPRKRRLIEEIVADFHAVRAHEDGNEFAVTRFQLRVGVDVGFVKCDPARAQFARHVLAQMAIGAGVKREAQFQPRSFNLSRRAPRR